MNQIRCSSLPRVLACPSSLVEPKHKPADTSSEPARLGTLVHEMMARIVRGDGVPDNLPELARGVGVPIKDVSIMLAIGGKVWRGLAPHFPEPRVEFPVESELLKGTADLVHHDGATAAVVDYKSGWAEGEHTAQVAGYAYALREMYGMPESGSIMVAPVFLRTDTMDVMQLTDQYLDDFGDRVRQAQADAGKVYGPGEACTYCRRALECEPRAEWLRSSAQSLLAIDGQELQPADLAAIYPQVQAIQKACDAYRTAMRSVVRTHGPQPVGSDRELKLIDSNESAIDPLKLREVMAREPYVWVKEDLYRVFKVSKKRLVDTIRDAAPRGHKKSREERLMLALEKAGAVTTSVKQSLRAVKK